MNDKRAKNYYFNPLNPTKIIQKRRLSQDKLNATIIFKDLMHFSLQLSLKYY